MGFELRPDEAPFNNLGRIVTEQMNATADNLRDAHTNLAERVHESRKRFKEVRALLRMFREPLGTEQFDVENLWYRDAGREISDYRDADAIVAAVAALPRKIKRQLGIRTMMRLRRVAKRSHHAAYQDATTAAAKMENLATQLPIAAGRLNHVPDGAFDGFASLQPGLIRTYRAGKSAMREAYQSRHPVAFHEWRKRVKDHWYHVQLLRPVWSKGLKKREKVLDKLSHILGDHHDLQVIRDLAGTEHTFSAAEAKQIDELLAGRQRRLEQRAKSAAREIYTESPKEFARRVAKRWAKWQRKSNESSG